MKQENRIIHRVGARELTEQEAANVNGGVHTTTVCTFGPNGRDGDPGEC